MTPVRAITNVASAVAVAAIAILAPAAAAAAATEIPPAPTVEHPVVDQTGTLQASDIAAIDAASAAGHAKNGQQTGVLITKTTGGEDIAEYAIKVARSWGIGEKGADNGVLILIALDDHKIRIEVGKGLEGDLTDVQATHIVSDQMIPLIKNGDVPGAVLAGVKAVQVGVAKPAATKGSGDIGGAFAVLAIWAGVIATIVVLIGAVGHLMTASSSGKRPEEGGHRDEVSDVKSAGQRRRSNGGSDSGGSGFLGGFAGGYLGSSLGSSRSSSSDSGSSYSGGGYDSGSSFGGGGFDGGGGGGSW